MPCYHIIERYPSMRSGPAVKRCYGSRKSAEITRKRGVTGDRADYYLDPGRALGVVGCYDLTQCSCAHWPTGHNAGAIPPKPERRLIVCARCGGRRRAAIEVIDPRTEDGANYCEPCADKVIKGLVFKRVLPVVRRLHADEPALIYETVVE